MNDDSYEPCGFTNLMGFKDGTCLLALYDRRIAELFGTSRAELDRWKRAYPRLREAFKLGRDAADASVALALYKRAIYCRCSVEYRLHLSSLDLFEGRFALFGPTLRSADLPLLQRLTTAPSRSLRAVDIGVGAMGPRFRRDLD